MKILLYPLGFLYIAVSGLKRKLYDLGLFKRKKLPVPVVSIGNITMGGSGKTPFTSHLAEKLTKSGRKVAIILRGYKRRSKGARLVIANSTVEEVGEEALLYRNNLAVEIAVAENREEAYPLFSVAPDAILLDDGFQHLRLEREKEILLLDASAPEELRPYPLGRLRESISALAKADLIVITKGKHSSLPEKVRAIIADIPYITVEYSWNNNLMLLLGIGNPQNFTEMAKAADLNFACEKILPDHAYPDQALLNEISRKFNELKCDYILTSEKDYIKWSLVDGLKEKLIYPKLELNVHDPEGHLDKMLR